MIGLLLHVTLLHVICDAALSTEERILSSKVRIASSILEHLDHTEVAVSDCLHYLQELLNMPAIQQVFSVHIEGGIKSLFKKTSRAEIVETVTMVNLILTDFITKFTKRRMAVFAWPQIQCGRQLVHLIHNVEVSVQKMRDMEITPPWEVECKTSGGSFMHKCAINSKGNIIHVGYECGYMFDRVTGEWQQFWHLPNEVSNEQCIAIGNDDTIAYVDSGDDWKNLLLDRPDGPQQIVNLSLYSSDGRIINQCTLEFMGETPCGIAVINDDKIVICASVCALRLVYICDMKGELIRSFRVRVPRQMVLQDLCVMCDNEITMAFSEEFFRERKKSEVNFYVYSQQGELKRTFNLSLTLPFSIAFDYATNDYTVCRQKNNDGETYLEGVSSAGRFIQNPIFLDKNKYNVDDKHCKLVSHKCGAMALISRKGVLYLQSPSK